MAKTWQVFAGIQVGAKAPNKKPQSDQKQVAQIEKFVKGILSDVEKENIRVFVVDMVQPPMHRAVVSLFVEYLRDPTMTEIAHKEYHLLGKVVHKVAQDGEAAIDLLLEQD